MKILITDLTRMTPGFVCAAGIDIETGLRVRPVGFGRLSSQMLCTNGGPLDVGNVIDFGSCEPCGSPPEVEDFRFDERRVRLVGAMPETSFWTFLRRAASGSLDAFGPSLVRVGASLATERGKGARSLVALFNAGRPIIEVHDFGDGPKLRFTWRDGVHLAVTDVRLYEPDLVTPSHAKINSLKQAMKSAPESCLSFGLTRAWQRPGDDRERHYLQLNNVHVPKWPGWLLCPES